MAGKPFKVGRFAHTLRVRLMREHLGIDVDALLEEDLRANEPAHPSQDQQPWDPDVEQTEGQEGGVTQVGKSKQKTPVGKILRVAADTAEQG
jgi:phospholipase D1/2